MYSLIGECYDRDAGLQYLNARYYDPKLAMFIQPGWWEVTKAGVGTNRYAYSFNDPVNLRDPGGNEVGSLTPQEKLDEEDELALEEIYADPDVSLEEKADLYWENELRKAIGEQNALMAQDAFAIGVGLWGESQTRVNNALRMAGRRKGTAAQDSMMASRAVSAAMKDPTFRAAVSQIKPGPERLATGPYKRPGGATTPAQKATVQGKPCVDCGRTSPKQFADHKEALVKEYYRTGTIDRTRMRSIDAVQPHCPGCSAREGAYLSRYSRTMKKELGFQWQTAWKGSRKRFAKNSVQISYHHPNHSSLEFLRPYLKDCCQ